MNELRWKQRFENFQKAFAVFERRVNEYQLHPTEEAYQLSLIQAFEFTFELSWKTMKDYLNEVGYSEINNAAQTIKQAYQSKLINNPAGWLNALDSRNETSHTYRNKIMITVLDVIEREYYPLVIDLHKQLEQL